jgi:hypothetical protein
MLPEVLRTDAEQIPFASLLWQSSNKRRPVFRVKEYRRPQSSMVSNSMTLPAISTSLLSLIPGAQSSSDVLECPRLAWRAEYRQHPLESKTVSGLDYGSAVGPAATTELLEEDA